MKKRKVGFIGLGIMGKPMAKNLLKAGFPLTVHDMNRAPVAELVGLGAREGRSSKEVASESEVVITMLPNSPEVQEAVLGRDGVLEGASQGSILIDMSSIAPLASRRIAQKVAEKGLRMLDAPVSGGEPKAIAGSLAIMVGGCEKVLEEVKDILSVMGSSVTWVGEIGSGNTAKLANQIIVALNIAAVSEAMILAKKAGVDPERVYAAIRTGLAGSAVLDAKMPLILDGSFKPGFRIELHVKDMLNVLDTAHELELPLPLSEQVALILQKLKAAGKGKDDHGGIVQYYEERAHVLVRRS